MKKCEQCNVEMIENIKIEGQHPFELGVDGKSNLRILYNDGNHILSRMIDIKPRLCPNCGKVELYIDPSKLNK